MNYDAPQFVTDVLTRFLKYMIPQVLLTIVSSFEEIKKAVIEIEGNTPKARQILLACDEVLSKWLMKEVTVKISLHLASQSNQPCSSCRFSAILKRENVMR